MDGFVRQPPLTTQTKKIQSDVQPSVTGPPPILARHSVKTRFALAQEPTAVRSTNRTDPITGRKPPKQQMEKLKRPKTEITPSGSVPRSLALLVWSVDPPIFLIWPMPITLSMHEAVAAMMAEGKLPGESLLLPRDLVELRCRR